MLQICNIGSCERKMFNTYLYFEEVMSDIVGRLAADSGLTTAQFETLLLQKRVIRGEMTVKEAAANRRPVPVAVGTYHRVLGQARSKVKESVITVLLSTSLGLIDPGELKKLVDLLGRNQIDQDARRMDELIRLINEIAAKMLVI